MASIDYFNIVAGVFSIASGVFAVGTYFRVAKYHRSLERAIVFPQLLDRLEANARNLQESARKRRSQGYLQSLELTRVCLRQVAPYLTDEVQLEVQALLSEMESHSRRESPHLDADVTVSKLFGTIEHCRITQIKLPWRT